MRINLLITALLFCTTLAMAQSKNYKYGVTAGAHIQHYNGNLGNSFFKFRTTCFGGGSGTLGIYLNKSFDLNLGASIGHFGYCQTDADSSRFVSLEHRCPGCTDRLGMGELRALMISGNVAIKYKFDNGILLKENTKFAPYIYAGFGLNRLSDNMGRNCVNVGNHISVNAGAGINYKITDRLSFGYNLGIGCFVAKKVYLTNAIADAQDNEPNEHDPEKLKLEKRRDLYMQNALTLGFNF
jgi:OOP family OmpA-OmpF porin